MPYVPLAEFSLRHLRAPVSLSPLRGAPVRAAVESPATLPGTLRTGIRADPSAPRTPTLIRAESPSAEHAPDIPLTRRRV